MKPIKLDATKLLGMKLSGTTDAKVGSKAGSKGGSKVGSKIGSKQGTKLSQ